MRLRPRIAVGQISSESNHFVFSLCDLDFFRATGFLYERDDLFKLRGTDGEVAGILEVLEEYGAEVVPLIAGRANSGGPLSDSCYRYLKLKLLSALEASGHVDGVILSHHGSMAAEQEDDTEGDIIESVRGIIGADVPIVLTLDLHANVTSRMVRAADAILGYEQYPHTDVLTTGARAARLLLKILCDGLKPVMAHVKLPMLLTGFNGTTQWGTPFGKLMREAKSLEEMPEILSTSLFFVGSYIDVPDLGCSSLVITNGDWERAISEAKKLAGQFWSIRRDFDVERFSVAAAVDQGRKIDGGPVLLLDTSDTTGGGASGDGIGLVKGLLEANVKEPAIATVVDPEAVQTCLQAGTGRQVTISLGHKLDPRWGTPATITGEVIRISDGHFQYRGGLLGGIRASMGPSIVLSVGSILLLITTYPTYEWADEQYLAADIDPTSAKFVGVKNMMNFRYAYSTVMKGYYVLDLPGPTPPDMRMLPFQRVNRPVYPLDQDLIKPDLRISTSSTNSYVGHPFLDL